MKIEAYTAQLMPLIGTHYPALGGCNEKAGTFTPMWVSNDGDHIASSWHLADMLDNIALVAEAGMLEQDKFVQQLFKDPDSLQGFIEILCEDTKTRITDRQWDALCAIANPRKVSDGFCTNKDIAEKIMLAAYSTKQLPLV